MIFSRNSISFGDKDLLTHLFHEAPPPVLRPPVALVGFSEEGVERLPNPVDGVGVGREDERSEEGDLLQRGLSLRCTREKVSVVDLLHHPLEERERLVEVHLVREREREKFRKQFFIEIIIKKSTSLSAYSRKQFARRIDTERVHPYVSISLWLTAIPPS